MIKKADPSFSQNIGAVRISIDDLIAILSDFSEENITLETKGVIYENLDEIRKHRASISIPIEIKTNKITLTLSNWSTSVFGFREGAAIAEEISRRLTKFVPWISRWTGTKFFILVLFLNTLGVIFADDVFRNPTRIIGIEFDPTSLWIALTGVFAATSMLPTIFVFSRPKVYYRRSNSFIQRHKGELIIAAIGAVTTIVAAML